MIRAGFVIVLTLASAVPALAGTAPARAPEDPPATGSIRGIVVDTRGGAPVGSVAVRLRSTGSQTMTDEAGRFVFDGVAAGDHELYVSAVDFILVKRTVNVRPDVATDVTIALSEGAGTYTESVDVAAGGASLRRDETVAATQTLAGRDLQALRGVLTNDPLRAVQMLPAVAAGDDFRSDFAIRGAGLQQMTFTFEGISTPFLLHSVQQVHDSGSVAMVNGDVLDDIVVSNGSYPQRQGNRIGSEIDFRMREGSRDRTHSHVAASAIDASGVVEGPIGDAKRGSWLATGRKSYLDLIVDHLYPEQNISFGFVDTQLKLVYDVAPKHQVQFAATAGRSRLERAPDALGAGNLRDADNRSVLSVFTWRYTGFPRFTLTQRGAIADNAFTNESRDGPELDGGTGRDLVYRADASIATSPSTLVEAGGELRFAQASGREQRLAGGRFQSRENFDAGATDASWYVHTRIGGGEGATISPGVRMDRRGLTDTTTVSPWLQALLPVSRSLAIRAGAGVYRQEPEFAEVLGIRGTRTLGLERATHLDIGLEGRMGRGLRWQMTAYDREDRNLVRLPGAEPHAVDSLFIPASLATRYENAIDGYARGVEWLVQRETTSGLSGWISYALGFAHYRDRTTRESFWGDYDQRHTLNVYANYRVSDRVSFSARLRAGSNFPAAGYWAERGGTYYLSSERNTLRIPAYSRVDVRMNRTFNWERRRMTLFVEGINVLNRDNMRFQLPSVNRRTLEATALFERMVPLIPSIGVLVEF